ncbi:hypothetical protein [Citrobacter portucalensis]|uniref:hypothetical protein n=1 Tax=Citrobacter portucalensis TaxID=1639133 RepID=UPI002889FE9B|nr:hypothetical protein [Citrobacter portucalensis]WNI84140.1 hypothetical protein RIK60_00380 [Citrobacter portucalensis]
MYVLFDKKDGNIIVLGGNQSDRINFVERSLTGLIGFFLPVIYASNVDYNSDELAKENVTELNTQLQIDNADGGK